MTTPPKAKAEVSKVLASNPQAGRNYVLLEHYETGIVLQGTEVKAIREGKASLKEAFVRIVAEEAWLLGCHISPYSNSGYASHEPTRKRKLLMHRKELIKLNGKLTLRGYTIVPLRIYAKDGKLKLEIALAQGKKLHDKREVKETKAAKKEIRQAVGGA